MNETSGALGPPTAPTKQKHKQKQPRFELAVSAKTARLSLRAPLRAAPGVMIDELELTINRVGSRAQRLDLRAGALAFRDHLADVERVRIRIIPTELPLSPRLTLRLATPSTTPRLSLWDADGALSAALAADIRGSSVVVTLSEFEGRSADSTGAARFALALRRLAREGRQAWSPGSARTDVFANEVRIAWPHRVEAWLCAAMTPAGFRVPNTDSLEGHASLAKGELILDAAHAAASKGSSTSRPRPSSAPPPKALPTTSIELDLGALDAIDSPWVRADVALSAAEARIVAAEHDRAPGPEISSLARRALAEAPEVPSVATRVMELASQTDDETLLDALIALPLPAAQRATLLLESALGSIESGDAERAERQLTRARDLAPGISRRYEVEVALALAREESAQRVAPLHMHLAEALEREGRPRMANPQWLEAARRFDEAEASSKADELWRRAFARCTLADLAPPTLLRIAEALARATGHDRRQDASEACATLLLRAPEPGLGEALIAAADLHRRALDGEGAAALFEARARAVSS